MPIIDDTNPAYDQNINEYWQNELENCKILLFEVNKAIFLLTKGNHKSYTLDTGQSRQTVTRNDLIELSKMREDLKNDINELEIKLKLKKNVKQVIPGW